MRAEVAGALKPMHVSGVSEVDEAAEPAGQERCKQGEQHEGLFQDFQGQGEVNHDVHRGAFGRSGVEGLHEPQGDVPHGGNQHENQIRGYEADHGRTFDADTARCLVAKMRRLRTFGRMRRMQGCGVRRRPSRAYVQSGPAG